MRVALALRCMTLRGIVQLKRVQAVVGRCKRSTPIISGHGGKFSPTTAARIRSRALTNPTIHATF
jgi:hypothetical protein